MPNKDGTGPLGKGPRTGRLGGGCGPGKGNNANNPGNPQGRKKLVEVLELAAAGGAA